jgi:hypothetical protein
MFEAARFVGGERISAEDPVEIEITFDGDPLSVPLPPVTMKS